MLAVGLLCFGSGKAPAADTLTWQTNRDRVTADVSSVPLTRLLENIARVTGWQVYLESNTTINVSAKFRDLPSGEALRHLLDRVLEHPEENEPERLRAALRDWSARGGGRV